MKMNRVVSIAGREVSIPLEEDLQEEIEQETERRRKILYKECVKHLNPKVNQTGLGYLAWCSMYATLAAGNCDLARDDYEIDGHCTKSGRPVVVSFR